MTRIALLAACCISIAGCVSSLGGAFKYPPEEAGAGLGFAARALVARAFDDVAPGTVRDYHTHLLTLNETVGGGYVNPHMLTWTKPIMRFKTSIYMSAANVSDLDQADEQYLERLARLVRAIPGHGKHYVLAFDQHYNADGTVNKEKTEFYTPNQYAVDVASRYPDIFLPAISVHPYRADALKELDKWGARGVKLIKWLPNAQGMDASDPRLDPYYAKVREYDMTILTHVGEEQAVESEEDQKLGNPLRFRRPLDQGTRIIMAHAGSLGSNVDFEDPERRLVPSYQLVLRMMREPQYRELLYADISAMTQFNRLPDPLLTYLEASDVHGQLVNGSDYPLPAINALIRLSPLVEAGMLSEKNADVLREIYDYNPLLFDFVLKRSLRHPQTEKGFPASVFTREFG